MHWQARLTKYWAYLSMGLVTAIILFLFGYVFYRGADTISWEFLTQAPSGAVLGAVSYTHLDVYKRQVLKEAFDVQREIAQAIDPTKPVYQVLVNRFDKDFTLEEIDAIFEKLKEAIRDILAKTEESRAKIDTSVLKNDADKQTMMELVREVQDLLGFDWNKGVMYEVHHPVCTCNGPRDSRPSTNYYELFRSLLAAAHETGHGLYNYNGSDEVAACLLYTSTMRFILKYKSNCIVMMESNVLLWLTDSLFP